MTTRFIAGKVVPLIIGNDGSESYFVDYGSPHAHVVKTNDASFLTSSTNALNNIEQIKFSSYFFDYLEIVSVSSTTKSFSARTADYHSGGKKDDPYYLPYYGSTEQTLVTHNLGYTPAFSCFDNDEVVNSIVFIEYGSSFRVLQVIADSTRVYVKENYFVYENNIPSISRDFNVQVFKANILSGNLYTPSNYGAYMAPSQVIFGQGKFDSSRRYLYEDAGGFPLTITNAITNEIGALFVGGVLKKFVSRFTINQNGSAVVYKTNSPFNDEINFVLLPNVYAPGDTRRMQQP